VRKELTNCYNHATAKQNINTPPVLFALSNRIMRNRRTEDPDSPAVVFRQFSGGRERLLSHNIACEFQRYPAFLHEVNLVYWIRSTQIVDLAKNIPHQHVSAMLPLVSRGCN
jgi:hypothetical protein